MKRISIVSLIIFLISSNSFALTFTWTGASNSSFTNPDNWTGGTVGHDYPTWEDNVIINAAANHPEGFYSTGTDDGNIPNCANVTINNGAVVDGNVSIYGTTAIINGTINGAVYISQNPFNNANPIVTVSGATFNGDEFQYLQVGESSDPYVVNISNSTVSCGSFETGGNARVNFYNSTFNGQVVRCYPNGTLDFGNSIINLSTGDFITASFICDNPSTITGNKFTINVLTAGQAEVSDASIAFPDGSAVSADIISNNPAGTGFTLGNLGSLTGTKTILNGSIRLKKGAIQLYEDLDISGNLVIDTALNYNAPAVVVLGNPIFNTGGLAYYDSPPDFSFSKVTFYGTGNSLVKMKAGDNGIYFKDLTIKKTGGGKVTIDSSLVYVQNSLSVQSGTLEIYGRPGFTNYSVVSTHNIFLPAGSGLRFVPGASAVAPKVAIITP